MTTMQPMALLSFKNDFSETSLPCFNRKTRVLVQLTARRWRVDTISARSFRLVVLMVRASSSFWLNQESNKHCREEEEEEGEEEEVEEVEEKEEKGEKRRVEEGEEERRGNEERHRTKGVEKGGERTNK